jgi:hypothetical protein
MGNAQHSRSCASFGIEVEKLTRRITQNQMETVVAVKAGCTISLQKECRRQLISLHKTSACC